MTSVINPSAGGSSSPPTFLLADERYVVGTRQQIVTGVPIVRETGAGVDIPAGSARVAYK